MMIVMINCYEAGPGVTGEGLEEGVEQKRRSRTTTNRDSSAVPGK
jgi:hypothetical protein